MHDFYLTGYKSSKRFDLVSEGGDCIAAGKSIFIITCCIVLLGGTLTLSRMSVGMWRIVRDSSRGSLGRSHENSVGTAGQKAAAQVSVVFCEQMCGVKLCLIS